VRSQRPRIFQTLNSDIFKTTSNLLGLKNVFGQYLVTVTRKETLSRFGCLSRRTAQCKNAYVERILIMEKYAMWKDWL